MSGDAHLLFATDPGPPRVRRQPGDSYVSIYLGTQRAPRWPDEAGALWVIDLMFDGRVALYSYDANYLRVLRLNTHAAGAQDANGGAR